MNAETELKFRISPHKLSSILRSGAAGQRRDKSEQTLVSTYYDTNRHKLRRHDLTLRVRKIEDRYVQTVKAGSAGGVRRGEWEHEVSGANPDLAKTSHTPLRRLATGKLPRKLKPVFQTDIRRMAQARRVRKSQIELAVDRGRISAGRRSRPLPNWSWNSNPDMSRTCSASRAISNAERGPSLICAPRPSAVTSSSRTAAAARNMPRRSSSFPSNRRTRHSA